MRYTKFKIKNFKGIKELTLDFDKEPKSKVFTLVGLNESGKTSILEAVSFFEEYYPEKERHKLIPKNEKIDFNDTISVEAEIELNELDNEKISKYGKSLGYKSIVPIDSIKIKKNYSFVTSNFTKSLNNWTIDLKGAKNKGRKPILIKHQDDTNSDWQKIVEFIRVNLLPRILYYSNFLFDFPDKIYLDKSSGDTVEQTKYRDVIQDILYSINETLTIQKHLLDRLTNLTSSNKEALEHTLAKMSTKVSSVVFKAWAKLFNSHGKEIIIRADSEDKADGTKRYYLEFKLKEGSSQYHIAERSLGFRWFFSFLLFTEFRKNRITETGELLFLLDEPASNLHSTAQKNLLKTFNDIIQKSTLVYTTHSHHLINPEWLNGVYIVRNKAMNYNDELNFDTTKTDIDVTLYKKFVASNPNQKDYYQPILDALDYQPGLLEKISEIIITEGKNDYYTFKYLKDIFLKGKFKNLNFYPGGGADANFQIIRLYLAWGRRFIIFLDADSHGLKSKKAYEKEFGIEVKDKIFTYEDVNNNLMGKATEQLFSDEEKLNITKLFDFNAESFDKSKFNTSIQNQLFLKNKANLSADTVKQFESILTFIESKVALS